MSSEENGSRVNWPFYNLLTVIAIGFFVVIGIVTDAIKMNMIIDIISDFGLSGLLIVLGFFLVGVGNNVITQNKEYMQEQRQMYKNNVHLVEGYESLAKDLKDVVIMNTEAMTRIGDKVSTNQFCPLVRKGGVSGE